jgi:hypothetical protein
MLRHRDNLPGRGIVRWHHDAAGLMVGFSLDYDSPGGREVALAVAHGHIGALSLGTLIYSQDIIGGVCRILEAEAEEISIATQPRLPGTSLRLSGVYVTGKSWPDDSGDRRVLAAFLGREGVLADPMLPERFVDVFASYPATFAKATKPQPPRVPVPARTKRSAPPLPAALEPFKGKTVLLTDRIPGSGMTIADALKTAGYDSGQIFDLMFEDTK